LCERSVIRFVDEAVLQLEVSTRQFLVFMNARNSRVNVLYRRKSGDFGLIEPSLGSVATGVSPAAIGCCGDAVRPSADTAASTPLLLRIVTLLLIS